MSKIFNGIHFYININNLNSVVRKDENSHENLSRTFHALDAFTYTLEKFAGEFDDINIEKFTTSRLHFYIPIQNNSETATAEMLEIIAFSQELSSYINKHSKYQSLVNFQIGSGADLGKYTEFTFTDKDSEISEMTTIGSPANRAAKLQSLCTNGRILVSKEVYDQLSPKFHRIFFGESDATLQSANKYTELTAYGASISDIINELNSNYTKRKNRNIQLANEHINNLNLSDMNVSDSTSKLDFFNLSLKNVKSVDDAVMLYSDIRGFTSRVDESSLTEINSLTTSVLSMMYKAVIERDGVHIQFQGDRESAVFNRYTHEPNDFAIRGILCAMKMLDEVDNLNAKLSKKINIGIGCAIGTIHATRVGMRGNKFNVTMGQTVSKADIAEDCIAGVGSTSNKTEIAITEELYDYISSLKDAIAKKISNSFTQRKYDGEIYYVSTTGLSNIQSELDIHTLNANAYRATNNNGVKPWGNLK